MRRALALCGVFATMVGLGLLLDVRAQADPEVGEEHVPVPPVMYLNCDGETPKAGTEYCLNTFNLCESQDGRSQGACESLAAIIWRESGGQRPFGCKMNTGTNCNETTYECYEVVECLWNDAVRQCVTDLSIVGAVRTATRKIEVACEVQP